MSEKNHSVVEINQEFPLTIKRLGINGEGVGYYKKQVVFVPGALPGEEAVVQVTKIHPKYAQAAVKTIRKESPHRVTAPCPVYDACGGCQLQHLEYNQQLVHKRDILIQALERHTKLPIAQMDIRQTIGMDNPWYYRNKSQFQVGKKGEKVIAGLYGTNSHQLVDIKECIVQRKETNKATQVVRKQLDKLKIPVYNERTKKGTVRTIVSRVGIETGQVQIVIVTATDDLPQKDKLIRALENKMPEIKSIMQNVNPASTSVIFGNKTILLSGQKTIEDKIEQYTYHLSARAFFQLNPIQTKKLYDEIKKASELTGKEKIVDAYCGSGTIGLWLSQGASEIRGMDVIKESIQDARMNAKQHGLKNYTYETGTAQEWMLKWKDEGFKPDVVVVDPPRTGCDESLLKTILTVKPKRFVYASCNPSTLAKDLMALSSKYKIEYIQPLDMFPQTSHVESVTQLVLKEDN
ncbi:23S rRNA (uracil(1939)-C(5))-methyltransferase RlmD [Jeotgalibacillus proteolyticus]|uniref:23S rRNA (Uracil(1939)-C(5))-methyltransferase RlmD n=2 Tax=Jeotgalibacillus proteolyticus TaxID=2082395 RepID=A0A2S5G7A8_9BACL|nr:23S rRNA (uracil(1939)-C(5))-methyltransferase RlmD [Jeotgalibacillus proteolyticus]PPA68845.1 23S rRNA (uracil(1939)-C(5))-methyltransferase RlmD [Jeotgalibacillus proteolyticus]